MAKVKVATLIFMVALLLCFTLTYAARHEPAYANRSIAKDQRQIVGAEVVEENCEGIGEEECLVRRTLAAHLDYIYTQKHKP